LNQPASAAATTTAPGFGNLLLGGTAFDQGVSYPAYLIATNSYWSGFGAVYSVNVGGGAAVIDGNVFIYGGTDGAVAQNTVTVFNLTGDTPPVWAPMPAPRAFFGYATDRNSDAYAIGGLDDNGQPVASVQRFIYSSGPAGAWSSLSDLPTARLNFPAVFDRTNQIYIFGGCTNAAGGAEVDSVLRYSIPRNTWTNLASLPVAVAGSAAALGADGKIYVAGGLSGGVATDLVQVYDPAANSWTIGPPLPQPLSAAALGVDTLGRLVLMGGSDAAGTDVAEVWRSQMLGVADSAPVLTQVPATNAIYLAAYSSTIAATGNPPPTYQLLAGPDGMTVDFYSGAIAWTPTGLAQIGSIPVNIGVSNYAGATNLAFAITVPNPPPNPVSMLAVVSVTETSVTLSWAPEPAVAGAVTYAAYLRHVAHSPRGSGVTVWYTQIGDTTTDTTLTIGGLTPGLSQAYYLRATGPGGSSAYSSIVATTASVQPPLNLRVTDLTSTSISLAWDAPTGQVAAVAYEVWGWFNNGISYTIYGHGDPNTFLTITGLVPGSSQQWGVRAFDALGYASALNYGFTVVNPVPVAPQFSSVSMDGGNFNFTITEVGSVLQTILIQASANPADPTAWQQIGAILPGTNPFTFTDTNAAQFPARFYRLVAP
jgi:hypothetical protein